MMKRFRRWCLPLTVCLLLFGLAVPTQAQAAPAAVEDPASVVDPLLGTSNEGNTFPGAAAPFGMVQFSPDTPSRPPGGGYAYSDNVVTGFGLNHLSGPGCGAMGDIPLLPTVGAVNGEENVGFSHDDEEVSAGAYAVRLANGVNSELTATPRSGMARFTFPATQEANLLFKLSADKASNLKFSQVSSTEVEGSITTGHFCASTPTYTAHFNMEFDRPITSTSSFEGGEAVRFDTRDDREVQVKFGLSYVSVAGAKANRAAENPGWDFDATRRGTHDAWNDQLGKIEIAGGTGDQQTVFYTALYHSLLHPNIVSDTDGRYRGFDHEVHTLKGGQQAQYANYSGWDIYRTQVQLAAMIAPKESSDSAQSMINNYDQAGELPKWSLNEAETDVMNGDPAQAILAGYHAFGARDFDTAAAKDAMVSQATKPNGIRLGQHYLDNYGYLPSDASYPHGFYGSVATNLEYSTQDFALSAFAGALGDQTTQRQFANRAQNWRNSFNTDSGFMQPRLRDGSWAPGFDPKSSFEFVEGSSWQYTGMVPFNVRGLADAMGGNGAMGDYLDKTLADLRGGSGEYADLRNEPSIELPWEYTYIGQPWKTQEVVRKAQNELWPNSAADWGVGNDDLGTMSAWYVFSALGFYPQTPGTADLAMGSPLFTDITITLGNGSRIEVNAPQAATDAPYIQSASLNGQNWDNAYLPPSFATNGGTLDLTLGTRANTSWATGASSAPPSYGGGGGELPPKTPVGPTGRISSGLDGKCLDADGGSGSNGTKAQIYGCNDTSAQRWNLLGDGTVMAFGKCLDANGGGTANGTKVQLWDCNMSAGQQWRPQPGTGALKNLGSSRCLDVPGSSDGTQLELYDCNGGDNQRWSLPRIHTGRVTSGIDGKCLDDAAHSTRNGTPIQLWSCNDSDAQQVTVPGDQTLRVLGRCVDVDGGGSAQGTKVQLWDCNGSGAQQWTYRAATGALVNPDSGRCLGVPSAGAADGTQLELRDCDGGAAQRWTPPSG